jgi:predicted alpha/beta-hydrolase family hydrolase
MAGRRAPDKAPVLVAAVKEAALSLSRAERLDPRKVFVGGRSMGGRICSMAAAEGMPAAGLVLLSYPLHPPGRPEALRTAHFPELSLPCLFVSGTKDALAAPAELLEAVALIPGAVTVRFVEGADHSMRRRDDEVAEVTVNWLSEQLRRRR